MRTSICRVVLGGVRHRALPVVEEAVNGVALNACALFKLPRGAVRRREPDDVAAVFFDGPAGDLKERGLTRSGRPLDIGEIRPATHGLNSGFLPIVQPGFAGDFSGNGPVSHHAGGFLAESVGGFQGFPFDFVEDFLRREALPLPEVDEPLLFECLLDPLVDLVRGNPRADRGHADIAQQVVFREVGLLARQMFYGVFDRRIDDRSRLVGRKRWTPLAEDLLDVLLGEPVLAARSLATFP